MRTGGLAPLYSNRLKRLRPTRGRQRFPHADGMGPTWATGAAGFGLGLAIARDVALEHDEGIVASSARKMAPRSALPFR